MAMIENDAPSPRRPPLGLNRMSIVKANQPYACLVVQGEAVAQTMRPFIADLNPPDDEANLIPAFAVREKSNAIQRQKRFERAINLGAHCIYVIR